MRFIFLSYFKANPIQDPEQWIDQIPYYSGILEALAKNNEVISLEKIQFTGELTRNSVQYYFKKDRSPRLKAVFSLNEWVASLKPDIVLVHSFLYPLAIFHLKLLLKGNTRVLVQNHAEKPSKGLKKWAQRWVSTKVNGFLFASRELGYSWVHSGNIASKNQIWEVMEVSSPFFPMDKKESLEKTGMKGRLKFLWVGRLESNKDPITVVKGFLSYVSIHKEATLTMIYQTEELLGEILGLLENSSQKDSVTLIGKVPYNELPVWYTSADIFISGSHYEGSGTAVAEAMSCGCMPVLTNIPPFRMLTNNERCGFLYHPGDPDNLTKVLVGLREEEIFFRKKLSLAYFQSHLSFQAIAERIQVLSSV